MPAPRWLTLSWQGTRFCVTCLVSFTVWSLWLALGLLLAGQLYIASTSELEVPRFLLRGLEERLAAAGVHATFGRTSFDPTGRILVEDVRVSLPAFAEPVVKARAIYAQLDPWALAAGKFESREVRVIGATLAIPAMLSRSGAAEEILRDLDATVVPGNHVLAITQFSGRLAGMAVSVHGSIFSPDTSGETTPPLPVADFIAHNFTALCRQLDAAAEQLAALDRPELHLDLAPSESRGAIASVTLFARGWKLNVPNLTSSKGALPIHITNPRIETRFPLLGDAPVAVRLEFAADDLALPFDAKAHGVRALIRGTLRPTQLGFVPRDLEMSAESLAAADFTASAVAARLTPGPLPLLEAEVTGRLMGAPIAVVANVDFQAETATVRFRGTVAPAVLDPISARLRTDVRKYFDFAALECIGGMAQLGPAWKFDRVAARVAVQGIDAYHVRIDEGRAEVAFDGRRFHSPAVWARIGDNFARGTYDQDLVTRDYRFLLDGQLRPLAIAGWFPGGWWTNFFQQFDLPVAPPEASVDVQGRWTDGHQSNVFVFVDTTGLVFHGAKIDHARSRLFIRPGYFDGLELAATSGTGEAHGTFTFMTEPEAWRRLDFNLASTVDLTLATQLLGTTGTSLFGPFKFAQPPALKVAGRLDGPAAPGGRHQSIDIEARSAGGFRLHDFPLDNITFTASVRDDDITVENLHAGFAGGVATGRTKLTGAGKDRRIAFDLVLKDASLGRVADTLQQFAARSKGLPAPVPGKFVQERANVRLDVTTSATGRYDDPLSYLGEGHAFLQGAELGEVPLLGLLSELLRFTALRFTTANAKFKVEGAKVVFSEFIVRGANSAIEARGDYALDRRELDFKAKILPFQESSNLLKSALGAVLSPLSNVFEVVLTGSLEKPRWALVLGPTNLLRALAPNENPAPAKSGEPAAPPAAAEPQPAAQPGPKP